MNKFNKSLTSELKSKIILGSLLLTVSAQAYAADSLESLIEGKGETTTAAASSVDSNLPQQTRLSNALQGLLGKTSADQNVFLRNVERNDWRKALLNWDKAFNGTAFSKTDNAKALKALLMFKAGLEISGVEKLFEVQKPQSLHSEITYMWKEALKDDNPAWETSDIRWNAGWSPIFGRVAEVKTRLKNVDLKTDVNELKNLASQLQPNTKERAMVDWQLALSQALNNKADEAAKIIGQLLKNKNSPYSEDLINLTAGRLLFQNGFFEAAGKYYEKISKKSDYYLEAQEELAWTYLRQGQTQNSVAVSKSLMNSAFEGYLGPEPYFVETLGHLKICDYPKVVDGLAQFPKRFKTRAADLAKLAKGENSPFLEESLNKLRADGVKWSTLRQDAKKLPRALVKDYKISRLIEVQKSLEKEAKAAESLYADSLALTGFQGNFEALKNDMNIRVSKVKASTSARVRELAKNEVLEIKTILDKLHIVEAELIQQVELADKVAKSGTALDSDLKKGTTGSKRSDALVFVADSEVWFDEISNYRVDVKKGCQTLKK